MKNLVLGLLVGLTIPSTTSCMEREEPPAKRQKIAVPEVETIKLVPYDKNKDDVDLPIITRDAARFSRTLENLIQDIGTGEPIPLPTISSKDWDAIFNIFVSPETQAIKTFEHVEKTLQALDLSDFLSHLNAIAYLDPQVRAEGNKLVKTRKLIIGIIKAKINAEPARAIELLQSEVYEFPGILQPHIALALLIAHHIVHVPIEFVDTQGAKKFFKGLFNIFSVSWTGDRLNIHGQNGVRFMQTNRMISIPIGIQELGVSPVAWSSDGRLAVGGRNGTYSVIEKVNEEYKVYLAANIQKMGDINAVAWSSDGRLAINCLTKRLYWEGRPGGGLFIRDLDGFMTLVDTQGLGTIYSVAWSSDERLAVGGESGVRIRERDGTMTPVDIPRIPWNRGTLVAWSPDDRLAIAYNNKPYSIPLLYIRENNGVITEVTNFLVGNIKSIAWSSDSRRLAIGGEYGLLIREPDGTMNSVGTQRLGMILSVAWSADGRLAIGGYNGLGIYDIPQGYENLSVAQALLIIKLARQEGTRILPIDEQKLYDSLPEEMRIRYPVTFS